jgi:heme exporter protein D
MSFGSIGEFLAMGGHGLYVWLAYGSAVVVVVANVLSVRFARRRFFRQARALARRNAARTGQNDANQLPGLKTNE